MTRKQAERIARELVERGRTAGVVAHGAGWTHVEVTLDGIVSPQVLDTNLGLIVGVMPIGWRLSGATSAATVTVVRRL